jgi:hypothetical protein
MTAAADLSAATPSPTTVAAAYEPWFDQLVAELRGHQLQLESGTASAELRAHYDGLMSGTLADVMRGAKQQAQKYFVSRVLLDFLTELLNRRAGLPHRLAVDYNDSEVLVWAEIGAADEALERALLLADAQVSGAYHDAGFGLTTTIVETADALPVPNHYRLLIGPAGQ